MQSSRLGSSCGPACVRVGKAGKSVLLRVLVQKLHLHNTSLKTQELAWILTRLPYDESFIET